MLSETACPDLSGKSRLAGKKLLLRILTTILVLISLLVQDVKAQDPITEQDGIPLIIYPDTRRTFEFQYPINYQQMDTMGVYGVVAGEVLDSTEYLEYFEEHNLKAIPWEKWGNPNNAHIYNYTDAHYTVWEAEGTDPTKGKVTLYHSEHTSISPDGKSVKAEGTNVPDGETIIDGPGYPQNGTYRLNDVFVHYFAEYRMKIEQDTTPPPGYLNDTVCTIMVTNINEAFTTEATVISKVVKVSEFNGWNNWQEIQISDPLGYTLEGHTFDFLQTPGGTEKYQRANCIQFKVIWAGLDYLNLYTDRVRVYDTKGVQLVNTSGVGSPEYLITTLVSTYINESTIVGWYGTDEPPSIDNYEPFRVVDSIIADVSNDHLRLHSGFTGGYPGTYTTWVVRDTFAFNNYQDVEFWLRAKPKNLQMNLYNYHYPWKTCCPGIEGYNEEWQTENILYVTNTLSRINKLDTSFAYSTQSGKFGPGVPGESILPSSIQINYHINLGLMYGAQELRLDPYFSNESLGYIGLILDNNTTTENYDFFRYTLVPRLNGWFGKELRKIHQKQQFNKLLLPIINPISMSYPWLESIGYVEGDGLQPPDFIDLGFFETHYGSEDIPYFMITSRWYSTALPGDSLIIHINKSNSGYINWNVTNFIDSSMQTIVEVGDIKYHT